jgi:hypothetical protein
MKKYALLKNISKGINFGIVVKSENGYSFYGWSDKGIEWSKWANENNGGLKDLPVGISVSEFKSLSEEMMNKIVINTKDAVAAGSGLLKSESSMVLVESEKFPNASKFPSVTNSRILIGSTNKKTSVAYKAKHFKHSIARSEIAFKVRNNELAFNPKTKQFNAKPNRASQFAERNNIQSKMSRGAERKFGERVVKSINDQVFETEKVKLTKRDSVGVNTKEVVEFFAKGRLGYTIGRAGSAAVRGITPNRRTRGAASRVIAGVLDPRKRRDVDGDGMIFDGTWREMPDPTRFVNKPENFSGGLARRNREGAGRVVPLPSRSNDDRGGYALLSSTQGERQRPRNITQTAAAGGGDGPNPPRVATARLMRMDPKNSRLAREMTYDPQNGDFTVRYRDGRVEKFTDVPYERVRKAGFDDKPDPLITALENEQNKKPSRPMGLMSSTDKTPSSKKPKVVNRTSFVEPNKGSKSSTKMTMERAADILGDMTKNSEDRGYGAWDEAISKVFGTDRTDMTGFPRLISNIGARIDQAINSPSMSDEKNKSKLKTWTKIVNDVADSLSPNEGRFNADAISELAKFIDDVWLNRDADASAVIRAFDPDDKNSNFATAIEAVMAYSLGKLKDAKSRGLYMDGRGRKSRTGSVIDEILDSAGGANEPELARGLNKVRRGMTLNSEERSGLLESLDNIKKNNEDFDGDSRLDDLIDEVNSLGDGGDIIDDLLTAADGANERELEKNLKKVRDNRKLTPQERANLLEDLRNTQKNNDDFSGDKRLEKLINDVKKGDDRGGLASRTSGPDDDDSREDAYIESRREKEREQLQGVADDMAEDAYIEQQRESRGLSSSTSSLKPKPSNPQRNSDGSFVNVFDDFETDDLFGRLGHHNKIIKQLQKWLDGDGPFPKSLNDWYRDRDRAEKFLRESRQERLKVIKALKDRGYESPNEARKEYNRSKKKPKSDSQKPLTYLPLDALPDVLRRLKDNLDKEDKPSYRPQREDKPSYKPLINSDLLSSWDDFAEQRPAMVYRGSGQKRPSRGLASSTDTNKRGSIVNELIDSARGANEPDFEANLKKFRSGADLTDDERSSLLESLNDVKNNNADFSDDARLDDLIEQVGGKSDTEDAINAINKIRRGQMPTPEERKRALASLKLMRSPDKNLSEDERDTIMALEKQISGLKSSTEDDGADIDDAIKAIEKVNRGERLTPDEKQKALNALKLARTPDRGLSEDERIGVMDMEKRISQSALASRTTGRSTRRPVEQPLSTRMAMVTTERASRPRGLASTTGTDARTEAPKKDAKPKRRSRLIIDMVDNFGKTKKDGDGELWESMSDEQKSQAKEAIAAQRKVIEDRLKTKSFKGWWQKAEQGSDKETLRAVKKRAKGQAGGTYEGRPKDDPLNKNDVQDLLVVLDDAVAKGRIKKYKLNDDGTVKTDKDGRPIMTEAYSRAARDLDDLLTILNMEEEGDFSALEHFHTGTRAAIHKKVGTTATGKFKMGDSSIAGQAGGLSKAQSVEELSDVDLGKAKKLSIGRRLLRVNERRAARARQRALRRQGAFRKGRILTSGDPELELKRARLRARALKRTMVSKFRKSRDADGLSRDMSKAKAEVGAVTIDNDGKVTITPRYVSMLSKLGGEYNRAKNVGDDDAKRKVFDQLLADLWVNSGMSGEPTLITEDEARKLVAAGWQPVIRGTGSEEVNSESYVEQFLTNKEELRFIPGQGMRAYGVGEYFAFPGSNWSGYRGTGDQRHTILALIPPSADIVSVGELTRERDKMRDLTSRAVDATKALGGRDAAAALSPGELAEAYRKALPNLDAETSRSGQIVSQLVQRLEELDKMPASDEATKEKKEILGAFDYLQSFTRQKDVGYFAPLIGVDGIDTNDNTGTGSPFLLHNRANVAAVLRPLTSDEAEGLAKQENGGSVGNIWRNWKTRPDRSREGAAIEDRRRVLVGGKRRRLSTRRPGSDGGDSGSSAPDSPAPTPQNVTPVSKSAVNTDSWKQGRPQSVGSNPATLLTDPNGTTYYTKLKKAGETTQQARERMETEVLAGKLYELAGVPVADLQMGTNNGDPVMLSRMIQSRMPQGAGDNNAARDGFVVDAWLANWDAPLNDNIKIDNNGRAVRLDVGGSLDYRAQGAKKGSGGSVSFGNSVGEMTSLQKRGNIDFTAMDANELKKQAQKLGTVTDDQIRKTVSAIVSDPARAKVLADTLIARRDDIVKRYG